MLLLAPHCTSVGAHTPVHVPLTQVVWPQSMAVPQLPVPSQISTPLPEHVLAPGLHVPVHCPEPTAPEQTEGHAVAEPYVPFAVHCATPLPTHSV